jgi:predicted secreted hydrolase
VSRRRVPGLAVVALVVSACSGPILANQAPTPRPVPTALASAAAPPVDPSAAAFPRDDAPHDRLTEWWYYTGHLSAADHRRFGFELVVFRAERGSFPVSWASHLAITDETGRRFLYDERSEVGPQVDRSIDGEGFDLVIAGDARPGVRADAEPWRMRGALTRHELDAPGGQAVDGTPIALRLSLVDPEPEPWLHGDGGWIDFGPAGSSYYHSRPRMAAVGELGIGSEVLEVQGSAWFDHQWGDFISVGGGWDWFAVNLDDGTDLTVSVVRDPGGSEVPAYGTIRDVSGDRALPPGSVSVEVEGTWTSPHSGIAWPAGWRLDVPIEDLTVELSPTIADQELDTTATTGVVYWEGSQRVTATRGDDTIGGEAYVELTGYAPAEDAS